MEAAETLCSMKNRHQGLASAVTENVMTAVETENKTQHEPVETEDLHTKIDCLQHELQMAHNVIDALKKKPKISSTC